MLILTRRTTEEIEVGGNAGGEHTLFDRDGNPAPVTFTLLGVHGNQVRFGVTVRKSVPVHRAEIAEKIRREHAGAVVDGSVAALAGSAA